MKNENQIVSEIKLSLYGLTLSIKNKDWEKTSEYLTRINALLWVLNKKIENVL